MHPLVKAFRSARPDADVVLDEDALANELEAALRRAQIAWPDVSVAGEPFAEALGRHAEPTEVSKVHAEDFYLACGCLANDAYALRALEKKLGVQRDGARVLTQYAGKEPLEAFLRALEPQADPEVALMKDRYGADLHDAFIDATRRISVDERKVLRSHYLDGLSIEDVGPRLADVQATIVTHTFASLKERLAVDTSEAESLLNLVRSELDAELTKLL